MAVCGRRNEVTIIMTIINLIYQDCVQWNEMICTFFLHSMKKMDMSFSQLTLKNVSFYWTHTCIFVCIFIYIFFPTCQSNCLIDNNQTSPMRCFDVGGCNHNEKNTHGSFMLDFRSLGSRAVHYMLCIYPQCSQFLHLGMVPISWESRKARLRSYIRHRVESSQDMDSYADVPELSKIEL